MQFFSYFAVYHHPELQSFDVSEGKSCGQDEICAHLTATIRGERQEEKPIFSSVNKGIMREFSIFTFLYSSKKAFRKELHKKGI